LAKSGCVCLQGPCVTCGACPYQGLPACYIPTNGATATLCPEGVTEGAACAPACNQQLCVQADGKTGCVCVGSGRYACAGWNGSGWQ